MCHYDNLYPQKKKMHHQETYSIMEGKKRRKNMVTAGFGSTDGDITIMEHIYVP